MLEHKVAALQEGYSWLNSGDDERLRPARQAGNRFLGPLKGLRIRAQESIPPAYVAWRARARTFKCLWGPGIDSKEWIPPAYVAWRDGTKTLFLLGALPHRLFKIPAQYYNPIFTRFLAPIDCSKITAQRMREVYYLLNVHRLIPLRFL
jgi:hypothetical protein